MSRFDRRLRHADQGKIIKKDGGSWVTVKGSITKSDVDKHFTNGTKVGVPFIRQGESVTITAMLDIDDHEGVIGWGKISEVASDLITATANHGLYAIPYRSGGGKGINLWFAWDEVQDAHSVRAMLLQVITDLGYTSGAGGIDLNQIEIFPKQDSVAVGDVGNCAAVPFKPLNPFTMEEGEFEPWVSSKNVPVVEVEQIQHRDSVELSHNKIDELLEFIDPDLPYDEWNKVLMAIHAVGGTFEQAEAWSKTGDSYEPEALTHRKWDSYSTDKDEFVGSGTLVYYAQQGGWVGDINGADVEAFELGEVEPVETEVTTEGGFPPHLLTPPTAIAREIIAHTLANSPRPQPILALGTMLSVLSFACGNVYQTPTGLRGNLYTVLVGKTASGKNAPLRTASELLDDVAKGKVLSRLASGAALHNRLADKGSLFVTTDEMGLWLSSVLHENASPHSKQVVDIMVECFTAADHMFYGKAYADSKNDLPDVANPYLTVIGAATPSSLFDAISEKEIHDGMFNRFIFLETTSHQKKRFKRKTKPTQTLVDWINKTAQGVLNPSCFEFHSAVDPYTVNLSAEAKTILKDFDTRAESHIIKGEMEAALWGRANEMANKIAMLLAISESDQPEVSGAVAQWSVDFMEHQIGFMSERLAGSACASKEENDSKRLLDIIAKAKKYHSGRGNQQEFLDKGLMPATLLRKLGRLDSIAHKLAVQRLVETEEISTHKLKGTQRGTDKPTLCYAKN